MADLSAERMGQEFIPPEAIRHITAFYFGASPEELPLLPYHESPDDVLTFDTAEMGGRSPLPMVIDIVPANLGEHHGPGLLICDAESNQVRLVTRAGDSWQERVLAEVPVPIRTEVVDIDRDGDNDVLTSHSKDIAWSENTDGLGSFGPPRVLPTEPGPSTISFTSVYATDLDSDGDVDVLSAMQTLSGVPALAWYRNTE